MKDFGVLGSVEVLNETNLVHLLCFTFFKGAQRGFNVNWMTSFIRINSVPGNYESLFIAKSNLKLHFNVASTLFNCALCIARPNIMVPRVRKDGEEPSRIRS